MQALAQSAGPSGFGLNEPCTSSRASTSGASTSSGTVDPNWQLPAHHAAALNDNPRTFIYNRTDKHIQHDPRSFYNLMQYEEHLQPNYHYFTAVQEHVTPFHREQAIDWLYDVAKEENCDGDVLLLAVAIIDRFLSVQNILKHDIQMVAGVALFIASKLKAPHPLTASKIAYYSDNSCPVEMLLQWELLVVATLEWETEGPTAFSFFDQLAARIPAIHNLRGVFQTVVHKCQRMHKLATLFPSMQCAIGLYYVASLPEQTPEFSMTIRNLLANMFQLQVNLLDNYIPMVKKCLSPTPVYTPEETVPSVAPIAPVAPVAHPRTSTPLAPAPAPLATFEAPLSSPEESPERPKELRLVLEPIPLSEQTPTTPLNDSGFSSDVSSPSSSEKKRRRSSDWFEDDITPPKIFKPSMYSK